MAKSEPTKPHIVCIPFPTPVHITPMLNLANLLHSKSFHVTFVHSDHNYSRLNLSSQKPAPGFVFKSIPDGLPPSPAPLKHIPSLCESTSKNCLIPFRELVNGINADGDVPKVSCILADGSMSFTLDVAEELGVPLVLFWTFSGCGVYGFSKFAGLVQGGLIPLKDDTCLTNGYLETPMDLNIPSLKEQKFRLKDLPTLVRTSNPNDLMLNHIQKEISGIPRASAIIVDTFEALEHDVLSAMSDMFPMIDVLPIGPLPLFIDQTTQPEQSEPKTGTSPPKEQLGFLKWLDSSQPKSVLYVNLGWGVQFSQDHTKEIAWGLANTKKPFLWVTKPDTLPQEFIEETKDRAMLIPGWHEEEVILRHESIGLVWSHTAWNITLECVCKGLPLLCSPIFADQPTNSWFACNVWGIGVEIVSSEVKRGDLEMLVRDIFDGERGKEMKSKASKLMVKAHEATSPGGSSYQNLDKLLSLLRGD